MDKVKAECQKLVSDVMGHLDPLEGTEYSHLADSVRIELENKIKDLLEAIQNTKELDLGKFKGVEYVERDGVKYRVCGMSTMLTGGGSQAKGYVGVSWGERIRWNTSAKVQSNVVEKKTAEVWGILVALSVASARKYKAIMVATEHPSFTRVVLKELKDGKLANLASFEALDEKFKEYIGKGIEIEAPNEVEQAGIESSSRGAIKDSKGLAKKLLEKDSKNKKK